MDTLISTDLLKKFVKKPTLDDHRSLVFEAVAHAIPTLGRDFSIDVGEDGENIRIGLKSRTLVGEMFIRYLRGNMAKLVEAVKKQKYVESDHDGTKTEKSGSVAVL